MKKAIIVLTMVGLTACGGPAKLTEQEAVNKLRNMPGLTFYSDDEARNMLYSICQQFEQGWGPGSILAKVPAQSRQDVFQVMTVAVASDCPDFQEDLDNYVKNHPLLTS